MKGKYWYIKERNNPQFKKLYYIALGNITVEESKKLEGSIYGWNVILRFSTKKEYIEKCESLGIVPKLETIKEPTNDTEF